jgi:predicted DNA-binding transcriptional regulator AlpA
LIDPNDEEVVTALATELWSRMVGAHADPLALEMCAKLALEQRLLGREKPAFGLDKLTSWETATYLGLQAQTLHDKKKRRALGIPEPYSIGRKLFWRRSELDEWIEAQRTPKPESRPRGRPRKIRPAAPRVEA